MGKAYNFAAVFEQEGIEIAAQCKAREVAADLMLDEQPGSPVPDRFGLAFSGGGIRSACVALGVVQGLAQAEMLRQVHYISAISGGGYCMGFLTAWIQREQSLKRVEDRLGYNTADGSPAKTSDPPVWPRFLEPDPLHFLRRYSSYLTPRLGLLSGDTLAFLAIYLRNLLLNQTLLLCALVSITLLLQLMAPRIWWAHSLVWQWTAGGIALIAVLFLVAVRLTWTSLRSLAGRAGKTESPAAYKWVIACGVVICAVIWRITPSWYALKLPQDYTLGIVLALAASGILLSFAVGSLNDSVEKNRGVAAVAIVLAWLFAGGLVYATDAAFRYWLIYPNGVVVGQGYVVFGLPLIFLAMANVSFAFIGILGDAFPDSQREWLARLAGFFLFYAVATTIVFAIVLDGPMLVHRLVTWLREPGWEKRIVSALLPGGWFFVVLSGLLAGNSAKTNGEPDAPSKLDLLAGIAPPVFLAGVLLMVSWGTHRIVMQLGAQLRMYFLFWLVATAMAVILGWRLDVNEFSMHLFYRNRLVRAFLGASNAKRTPSPFTGFAHDDDIALEEFTSAMGFQGPYPLWGTTLNLTAGEDLAWQQRKGASFLYSPLFCGWDYVDPAARLDPLEAPAADDDAAASGRNFKVNKYGFRSTLPAAHGNAPGYGGKGGKPYVGTAMAASGAAASPNMGYHTKPGIAALLAIFNVRLGWWTGNPHTHYWDQYAPGIWYLLAELMGRATDSDRYIYLSDGGHFENLGIYELVRRRVRFIVCSDADEDHAFSFEDLGNAVERCRRDFGVEIRLSAQTEIAPAALNPYRKAHYAVGEIVYPGEPLSPPGLLLYLKSSLTNDEPADVLGRRAADSAFPHDTTANQFFNESSFEAYRALGEHMMSVTLSTAGVKNHRGTPRDRIRDLFHHLRRELTAT